MWTALLHISSVSKWSGTNSRLYRSMCKAILHTLVVKRLEVSFIKCITYLFDIFRPGEDQIYPGAMIFVSDNFKNDYLLLPQPLLVFWHTPFHHTTRMTCNRSEFLFYFCFLGLAFLIPIVPFNSPIIIAPGFLSCNMWVVYIPHFLCCHKDTCIKESRSSFTALMHISWALNQSGTYSNNHASLHTTSSHISWLFNLSGTYSSIYGWLGTASLHISWVLKRSVTYFNNHVHFSTALIHISSVLKQSGTFAKEYGSNGLASTALSHIS